jgi:hypothetical protein
MILAAFRPKTSDDVSDNGWNDILKTSGEVAKGEWKLPLTVAVVLLVDISGKLCSHPINDDDSLL